MVKTRHEIRDAVHGLITFDDFEKRLIDSRPFQRLRDIHQLAMCYQVYPGTTHKRFEHSIGVMHLAGRIFDTITDSRNTSMEVKDRLTEELRDGPMQYWRQVVRAGALFHDVGHLPFSHAAEKELLPEGWNHERITAEFIRNSELAVVLRSPTPPVDPEHVVSVAWDPGKRSKIEPDSNLSPWAALLSEIVTGDTFGADRMDYLLRDSLHAGVVYGGFDTPHLINALRIVINQENDEIALGIDIDGIHSAEALLLARYFMYIQVYFHDVRRVYDLHLKEFLKKWLPNSQFPTAWKDLLAISDSDVLRALRDASSESASALHAFATRITERNHYRTVFSLQQDETPDMLAQLVSDTESKFGSDKILSDANWPTSQPNSFLVQTDRDTIQNSLGCSSVIRNIPDAKFGLIFADPEVKDEAKKFIVEKTRKK